MIRSTRIRRSMTVVAVVLAHVLLVWIIMEARFRLNARDMPDPQPVMATIIVEPRDVPPGEPPIEVKTEAVKHPQNLAPKIPDIPEDRP